MDSTSLPPPSVESFDSEENATGHERSSHRSYFQFVQDRWVGFWERRRQLPSPRAWEEVLSYYEGLYQTKGPDPAAFRRLILRNGVPLWNNPFPEGEARHFLYHPDGLVLADLEAILEDLAHDWQQKAPDETAEMVDPETEEEFPSWPTMEKALELRELEKIRQQRHWSRLSAVCWGMVLLHATHLDKLKEKVHEDNLAWATVHAWKVAPWQVWGIEKKEVLGAAVKWGILTEKVSKNLLDLDEEKSVTEGKK